MLGRLTLLLLVIVATMSLGRAVAADGSALGVDAGATALTGRNIRTLTVGADLFIGDKVETNQTGLVQIKFADTTELVVGPGSSLVLEDYLLRADGSAGKLAINALAGTFRFVTGNAAKDRYEISTTTGTIGIRGTAFDFNVIDGVTSVLLYHGAAKLCSRTGRCVTLDDVCEVGQYDMSESEVIGLTGKVSPEARKALRSAFRYAESQMPLLRSFRVRAADTCLKQTVAEDLQETKRIVPPAIDPPPVDPCATPGSCGGGGGAPEDPPDDVDPPEEEEEEEEEEDEGEDEDEDDKGNHHGQTEEHHESRGDHHGHSDDHDGGKGKKH